MGFRHPTRKFDFWPIVLDSANSLTQEITERVACPVLWVKEYEETPSFWESLFRSDSAEVEQKTMTSPIEELIKGLTTKLIDAFPNLAAGVALLLIAWFFGWLGKRIMVHILSTFRFDRPLQKFRWGAPLARAEVRHAFYNSFGTLAFLVILLIFLNASFDVLGLTVLSDILRATILFLPRLLICLVMIGLGWMVAGWVSQAVHRALLKEAVPTAGLIARFSKSVVFLFFSAMALTQLNIAREIVIIGFSVTLVTLSAISVVLTAVSGRALVESLIPTSKRRATGKRRPAGGEPAR